MDPSEDDTLVEEAVALTVPRITARMRADSRHVIIPGEPEPLGAYLAARGRDGLRVNVNHLGEEVLGAQEAAAHMATYRAGLRDPRIEGIAVKISTLSAQIHPLPFEETVARIGERLARLYRDAAARHFTRPDGTRVAKSVTLDMEAYRDLGLTAAAFMRTLDRPEFHHLFAGMALQAYLPDSFEMLQAITAWARKRVAAGGSPVKIRIVKGANMEMEQLEAAHHGWPQAPFDTKLDVDANWKRMAAFVLEPDNARAVHLGAASHNLFDLAYALLLARRHRVEEHLTFEMIEGMANHVRRAVHETGSDFLTYAPVAEDRHFLTAVAYLIRRLDENTGPQNFLRHLNGLKTGTPAWQVLAENFRASVRRIPALESRPRRRQNRGSESISRHHRCFHEGAFGNEPNTDWALAANRAWAAAIRARWMKRPGEAPVEVPVVVGGQEIFSGRQALSSMDPNQLPLTVEVARCALANAKDVARAVTVARDDPDRWRRASAKRRHRVLSAAANEIRKARGDMIGAAAATTGKVFTEADPEVSEAVDFTEFYPFAVRAYTRLENLRIRGRGVGVVISPWDFTAKTGPLIRPPRSPLVEALTQLDPGESWALTPRPDPENPHLWSPGIKYGVRPGSTTHLTEFFGPVLGVMRAENVEQAAEIANGTGYGLTAGIASLDLREQKRWMDKIRAGNLYINRGTTGAVVLRQPFGGMGKSAVGAGLKAGGPHYVAQFLAVEETGPPPAGPIETPHPLLRLAQRWELKLSGGEFGAAAVDLRRTLFAIRSYLYHVEREFAREVDPVHLRGQDNRLRHLPLGTILVRLHPEDTLFESLARLAAVRATGNRLRVSIPPGTDTPATRFLYGPEGRRLAASAPVFPETDAEVADLIAKVDRIRYAAPGRVPPAILAAAADAGFHIACRPVLMEGRLELLHYYRQQCVSINYHRYGNLGFRTADFADA